MALNEKLVAGDIDNIIETLYRTLGISQEREEILILVNSLIGRAQEGRLTFKLVESFLSNTTINPYAFAELINYSNTVASSKEGLWSEESLQILQEAEA